MALSDEFSSFRLSATPVAQSEGYIAHSVRREAMRRPQFSNTFTLTARGGVEAIIAGWIAAERQREQALDTPVAAQG